jgi:hypothetical protein
VVYGRRREILKQTPRDVHDSPTPAQYEGGVQTDAFLRAPIEGDVAPPLPDTAPLPSQFYRRINLYAWLGVIGAGALGWFAILRFF